MRPDFATLNRGNIMKLSKESKLVAGGLAGAVIAISAAPAIIAAAIPIAGAVAGVEIAKRIIDKSKENKADENNDDDNNANNDNDDNIDIIDTDVKQQQV